SRRLPGGVARLPAKSEVDFEFCTSRLRPLPRPWRKITRRRMGSYWATLASYVDALDKAGKLIRVTIPINKDTELHPLVRLQFRGLPESQRKAFLFENVTDSRGRSYDIPVLVGALAGSAEIYALGMRCKLEDIEQVWK